jgi:hypothetical protein
MSITTSITLAITSCTKCPFHKILPDPDPDDWFCDDDVKVMCTKMQRPITVACRPHHIERETEVPQWCPLLTTKS